MPKARGTRMGTLDDILNRNVRTRVQNVKGANRAAHDTHMTQLKNVQARDLSEFALQAGMTKITLRSDEYPGGDYITWFEETTGKRIGDIVADYLASSLSGIALTGYAKSSAETGNAALQAVDHNGVVRGVMGIQADGDANVNLENASRTAAGQQALNIKSQVDDDDIGNTVLYLDTKTNGTPIAGFGTAIALRAQKSNGDMETVGYLAFQWLDPTTGEESGKIVLGVFDRGSIITTTLLQGSPYTVALLHFNGTDGSTSIIDILGKIWTAQGNAQIDTAQSKFGGAALLLDGTGDYVSSPDHADWRLDGGSNSNKWTVDFWVRFNGDPGTGTMGFVEQYQDNSNRWDIVLSNNNLVMQIVSGGSAIVNLAFAWNPATATWYHVAMVKNGTSGYTAFVDGTQVGATQTDVDPMPDFSGELRVGTYQGGSYLNGWMDELRISKGIARWTANFTPPSAEYGA